MPKIRRKSIENDFLLIFFYRQSEGAAQSSILMILRHPRFTTPLEAVDMVMPLLSKATGKWFWFYP